MVKNDSKRSDQRAVTMEMKISSHDKPTMEELFGVFSESRTIKLADAVDVRFQGIEFKKGIDFPEIAAFVITVASHVPAALAADLIKDWIAPRFHKRTETITIDEEEFKFSKKGKLRKVIKRHIKHERK